MDQLTSSTFVQLRQFFEQSVDRYPHRIAIVCDNNSLSYAELELQTNQFANYLQQQGIQAGHCVGIFLERSLSSYIAILALLKIAAVYVPLEVEHPDERINYILADMPFAAVITSTKQYTRSNTIQFPRTIIIDEIKEKISKAPSIRPPLVGNLDANQLCYVIYTSGSTGKPKGVEITQRSICHYVRTASALYEMTETDRVYQGFSLAFDASLEELWMAFANGATLIACTSKDIRSGVGLIDFLNQHQVTVFSTIPTLLATLFGQIASLRLLILGGEACSNSLVDRWKRPGLKIFNTYGPTEATVIATYAECQVGKPITIGKPLPGYEVVILDESGHPLANEQPGELCIGGVGLARGYVNRPELTATKFIQNPAVPTQRLYRTGDLAMMNAQGDIVFLGRVDDQVKLRGFRIELNEIESTIANYPGIEQAVVALQDLGQPVLVAYLRVNKQYNLAALKQFLLERLPHYMLPSYFELIDSFPVLSSGKVDRKALPPLEKPIPVQEIIPPKTALEQTIAQVWQAYFQHEAISIEADFFYDLGGHSLAAAGVVSKLREVSTLQDLSILDIYKYPTIKQLAAFLSEKTVAPEKKQKVAPEKHQPSSIRYFGCCITQFFGCLFQYALRSWQLLILILCYNWITSHETAITQDVIFIFLASFIAFPILSCLISIAAKWLLLGRVKPGQYKLWSFFYFRWWLVNNLLENLFSPSHLVGSPLLSLYYRLLGAKIGKNCHIATHQISVPDLLTIGNYCAIGADARLLGYVVEDGWLKIGSITIQDHCFVGARSVIDRDTLLEEGACLADMSLLPSQSIIPAKQFFSGSPAVATVPPADHISQQTTFVGVSSSWKNTWYGILHYGCLLFTMMVYYCCYIPVLELLTHFHEQSHYIFAVFVGAPIAAIIFLGLYYLCIYGCKKIIMNQVQPGTYPLQSGYYLRQWTIVKLLDVFEVKVMSDTLYFPLFLRFLGAKLGKRVEMGETPHLMPDLITIEDEGFTASEAALAWPSIYNGMIKYAPVQIGRRGFVGNDSLVPLGTKLGGESLLGCLSVLPPNNQAAAHRTTWLGSPAIFLPRREEQVGYTDQDKYSPPKKLVAQRLLFEFVKIILPTAFNLIVMFTMLCIFNKVLVNYSLGDKFLLFPMAEFITVSAVVLLIVALKWTLQGRLKPAEKPIWNIFIWKNDIIKYLFHYFVVPHFNEITKGSPLVAILFRLMGAKIGKRVFIYSNYFEEFDLIRIGHDVCINYEAGIQTHLYEDRIFKMSTIEIGDGCNIGVGSIVLYSTVMEKNASLGNLSLLMKGEHLPPNTQWEGIPAQPAKERVPQLYKEAIEQAEEVRV